MKLAPPNLSIKQYTYEKLWVRIAAALLGSNLVVLLGQPTSFLHTFSSWGYYKDSLISFLVALAMLQTVYYFTVKLDLSHPWPKKPESRRWRMILLCIILPLAIDTAGMFPYYYTKYHINILMRQRWYTNYLPLAVVLLTLINTYYYLRFKKHETIILQEQLKGKEEEIRIQKEKIKLEADEIKKKVEGLRIKAVELEKRNNEKRLNEKRIEAHAALFNLTKDAVFYYLKERAIIAVLKNGEEVITAYLAIKEVPASPEFIYPNHSVILRWDNIIKVVQVEQNFEITLLLPKGTVVKVSRDASSIYRKQLKALMKQL
ncbi:hypothetical protein ACVWYN_000422 [Pedobacter sp. UYP24]